LPKLILIVRIVERQNTAQIIQLLAVLPSYVEIVGRRKKKQKNSVGKDARKESHD
jgi:hypothetical protein